MPLEIAVSALISSTFNLVANLTIQGANRSTGNINQEQSRRFQKEQEIIRLWHQERMTLLNIAHQKDAQNLAKANQDDSQSRQYHFDRLRKFDVSKYEPGKWLSEQGIDPKVMGIKPLFIISTNLRQDHQFQDIKFNYNPLENIYATIKNYSNIRNYVIIRDTKEPILTDQDASAFYTRELFSTPVILLYANFSGNELYINCLYSGISEEQFKTSNKVYVEKELITLAQFPYSFISEIVQPVTSIQKGRDKFQILLGSMIGTMILTLIDKYYSNFPEYGYKSNAKLFLNSQKNQLEEFNFWQKELEDKVNEFDSSINKKSEIILTTSSVSNIEIPNFGNSLKIHPDYNPKEDIFKK